MLRKLIQAASITFVLYLLMGMNSQQTTSIPQTFFTKQSSVPISNLLPLHKKN
jgi:hypothetical protein